MNELALLGGKPVRTKPFPSWPNATDNEKKYVNNVLNSNGWGIFRSDLIEEFGEKFADYHGVKYSIPCANATVALQVQLESLSIGRGDEVITTVFTCISTITAIVRVGAIPIFIDVKSENYCIDTDQIEGRITDKTKAIIAVHLYGSLCDLDVLTAISKKHNIVLIEDAAQVPGSFFKNKGVGTFGASGSFSFQESKIMTSGEGGIIITNDEGLAELANSYINCGRIRSGNKGQRRVMGVNYRMTSFQAAVLMGQLELLDERTRKREKSVGYLNAKLKEIPGIQVVPKTVGVTKQACYYYIFKIQPEILGIGKDLFVEALEAEGIPTRKLFFPIYKDPLYNLNEYDTPEAWNYYLKNPIKPESYLVAERASFEEGVAIWHPFLLLEEEDLKDLVAAVEKVAKHAVFLKRN